MPKFVVRNGNNPPSKLQKGELFFTKDKNQMLIGNGEGVQPNSISTDLKDQNTGETFKFWQGSQELFDAIVVKNSDTVYFVQ